VRRRPGQVLVGPREASWNKLVAARSVVDAPTLKAAPNALPHASSQASGCGSRASGISPNPHHEFLMYRTRLFRRFPFALWAR
jgi:hypothetical protein